MAKRDKTKTKPASDREVDAGPGLTHGSTDKPKRGRKLAAVVAMLSGPLGASLRQIEELTGWKPHSVRAALSGLRKASHRIEGSREGSTVTLYRIVGSTAAATEGAGRTTERSDGAGPREASGAASSEASGETSTHTLNEASATAEDNRQPPRAGGTADPIAAAAVEPDVETAPDAEDEEANAATEAAQPEDVTPGPDDDGHPRPGAAV